MATAVLPPEADAVAVPKGRSKKLVVGVLVLLLAVGGAAYWFLLKPGDSTGPKPGVVAPLDSVQINLASGHYLRLGIALQLTDGTKEVDGSQALDAAIGLFSGLPMAEVDRRGTREKLRTHLEDTLEKRYDGEVMDVYFTEFVTQ